MRATFSGAPLCFALAVISCSGLGVSVRDAGCIGQHPILDQLHGKHRAGCTSASEGAGDPPSRPNFVVIMTDDQDAAQNSTHAAYMPHLHRHLVSRGVTLANYFVTTPICCPSRTNLWSGRYAHNTNFTDVMPPYGGYQKWKGLGIDRDFLPLWMQKLGYHTTYAGKFIVDYSVNNFNVTPAGWSDFDALVLPYTFDYNLPTFSRNGGPPVQYPGHYSTDVVAAKGLAQVKSGIASGKPFFAQISPIAPHTSSSVTYSSNGSASFAFYPAVPAPRHWHLFAGATLPETANLNQVNAEGLPRWMRDLPRKDAANITYMQESYRLRLRALAAVDDMIGQLFETLKEGGVLDNTYVVFTSDNGYHVMTHRFGAGKTQAYEEDLRVPFIIRGPGLKQNVVSQHVGLHVDFAPTILTLAGAGKELLAQGPGRLVRSVLDGTPLPLAKERDTGSSTTTTTATALAADYPHPKHPRDQFPAEFWGHWTDELLRDSLPTYVNNTWKAVRAIDAPTGRSVKLVLHCTGERELYDLQADPAEVHNLYPTAAPALKGRLEALLAVLVVCKGASCVRPFKVLHPNGNVSSLWEAMDSRYDALYNRVEPFRFRQCLRFQSTHNEVSQFRPSPRNATTYENDQGGADGQGQEEEEEEEEEQEEKEEAQQHAADGGSGDPQQGTGAAGADTRAVVAAVELLGVPLPPSQYAVDFAASLSTADRYRLA